MSDKLIHVRLMFLLIEEYLTKNSPYLHKACKEILLKGWMAIH